MAAWRRSSSASSFTAPCPGTVGASELSRAHCPRDSHIARVCPGQERPCPALGKRLAGDARQALGACFLTRCKFFLFKALTFPCSPFPSPFVPPGSRRLRWQPRGDQTRSGFHAGVFPGATPGSGAQERQRSPTQPQECPFFFFG